MNQGLPNQDMPSDGDPFDLKNLAEAENCLNQAIALRRRHARRFCELSPYALVARARGLEHYADVSQRLGNSTAAQEALAQAKSLREQAHVASGA